MPPIDPASPESHSPDMVSDTISQLKALFPEAFTEGPDGRPVIDFEVLKQLLGGAVDEREEKYGLNWHGKRKARELALTPSTGTLRPCPEDSVEWDTTRNLMIEGDNLEVLKLIQKSYAGKVKLIYIDPPYNTGKDFVYPDNFKDNIKNYLELTGQIEGGRKFEANTDASGRFHTDWLNMMYPRLKLAKNLLRDDGIILISIDDREISNLINVIKEIYGEENYIATFVWTTKKGAQGIPTKNLVAPNHEYIVAAAKNSDCFAFLGLDRENEQFSNPDHDSRGVWKRQYLQRFGQGFQVRTITNPKNGMVFSFETPYAEDKLAHWIEDGTIIFPEKANAYPARKEFLTEYENRKQLVTYLGLFPTKSSTEKLFALFDGEKLFQNPKPDDLIKFWLAAVCRGNEIVLDFFAGSGTTGHAVMAQNAADGGTRRYILVQLPEPLDPNGKEQKTAADFCIKLGKPLNIAELAMERLRRAGNKIREEATAHDGNSLVASSPAGSASSRDQFSLDLGFRVFKLDSSNIRAWDPEPANLETALLDSVDHVKQGRSEGDILYELLLKLGLDLVVPIETRKIGEKDIYAIGAGSLFVCLTEKVTRDEVKTIALGIVAWRKELNPAGEVSCVFRDSSFEDNVAKTNLTAILLQSGIGKVRSI
jgi:adenine-specific DNA-methyltransferase